MIPSHHRNLRYAFIGTRHSQRLERVKRVTHISYRFLFFFLAPLRDWCDFPNLKVWVMGMPMLALVLEPSAAQVLGVGLEQEYASRSWRTVNRVNQP